MTATPTISLEGIMSFLNSITLSSQNKRWLGEHLIEQAMQEEKVSMSASPSRRVSRVKRHSVNSPSDAELEARFAGMESPAIPADPEWRHVINANTGKTIKPIEKWL